MRSTSHNTRRWPKVFVACAVILGLLVIMGALAMRGRKNLQPPDDGGKSGKIQNVYSATISRDGSRVALGTMVAPSSNPNPYEITALDVTTRQIIWKARTTSALSLALSADNQFLVSDDFDGFKIWRATDGGLIRRIDLPADLGKLSRQVFQVAIASDNHIIAGLVSFRLYLWSIPQGKLLRSIDLQDCATPTSVAFDSDAHHVAVGCGETNHGEKPDPSLYPILVVDTAAGQVLRKLTGHVTQVSAVAFNNDGSLLVSGGGRSDGDVKLWRVADGSLLRTEHVEPSLRLRNSGYFAAIYAVAFSWDGTMIAYAGSDDAVHALRLSDGRVIAVSENRTTGIRALSFASDGQALLGVASDGAIEQWRLVGNRD